MDQYGQRILWYSQHSTNINHTFVHVFHRTIAKWLTISNCDCMFNNEHLTKMKVYIHLRFFAAIPLEFLKEKRTNRCEMRCRCLQILLIANNLSSWAVNNLAECWKCHILIVFETKKAYAIRKPTSNSTGNPQAPESYITLLLKSIIYLNVISLPITLSKFTSCFNNSSNNSFPWRVFSRIKSNFILRVASLQR